MSDSIISNPTLTFNGIEADVTTGHRNGHELLPSQERYTFPSSGQVVTIQKVSGQMLADYRNAVRRKHKPPEAPMQTVNIAGEDVTQENPADPDYLVALGVYDKEMAAKEFDFFMRHTLVEYDKQAVATYRQRMKAEEDIEYSESDWYIFLWHLAALDPADYEEFQRIALSLSQPTKQAIDDAKERFQRRVQRP